MRKFVLLDRDGVINRRIADGYVTSWEQFEFLPRALDALKRLADHGYETIVVSNQAGVGKGLLSPEVLEDITRRFVAQVEAHGGRISKVYYCPHRPEDRCRCRKPEVGLLLQAQAEHGFNFADTFLVGDSESDLMAAERVGSPAVLVAAGRVDSTPAAGRSLVGVVESLNDAVGLILSRHPVARAQ